MLLAEAANAVGLRFIGTGLFASGLSLDPVELLEEPKHLLRRPAAVLSGLERVNEASPGMGHASDMSCTMQGAPGGVAISDQYAAIVTEEGLRVNVD